MRLGLIISLFAIGGITTAYAQMPTLEGKWWYPALTNTQDVCIDETTGNVYTVGNFSRVNPPNPRLAFIDQNTGIASTYFPQFISSSVSRVNVAIPDEAGGWFFGGRGTSESYNALAYMDSEGVMSDWNPVVIGDIHTLLILGDTLYVGGDFDEINDVSRNNLASFDISTGNLTDWNPEITANFSPEVRALTTDGTKLFIGGKMGTVNGQPRSNLAAFDRTTGELTSWAPNQPYPVNAFELYNELIYTAPSSGSALAFDANTGAQTTWSIFLLGQSHGYDIAIIDDMVYIVGDFMVNSSSIYQHNLAIADPVTGELSLNGFEADGEIFSITSTDEIIYLGGNFSEINGFDRHNAAAIDKLSGLINEWNPEPDGSFVHYLTTHDNLVVATGNFDQMGGVSRDGFVELSGETGSPTEWSPEIELFSLNRIHDVEIYNNMLFIAGAFTSDYGNNLAVFDLTTKQPLELFNAFPDDLVYSMEFKDDKLYIGGEFLSVGSDIRNYLACIDLETGNLTDWTALPNDEVRSLEIKDDQIFIGGKFTLLNGFTRNRLGALSLTDGSLLPWDPSVGSIGGYVKSILATDDEVFVGGEFEGIGGQFRNLIASVDITTGTVNPWNANIGEVSSAHYIHEIAIFGDNVYIGGNFDEIDGTSIYQFAGIDRVTGDLATNTSGITLGQTTGPWGVQGIAISENKIYIAGNISVTGFRRNLGVYSPLCNPPILNELSANQNIICPGAETVLTISDGTLNSSSDWIWNSDGCDSNDGTLGVEITVSPSQTTTYYVQPMGGCVEEAENACLSITIEVEEDDTPPEIIAPENTTLTNDDSECFSTDIDAIGMAEGTDTCSDVEITNDAPDTFPLGQTVVTWFATDVSGNVSSATQNIIVEDSESPQIICPDDIILEGDLDNCTTNVTWATPVVTDNCSTELVISSTQSSGDLFEFGLNEITYTVQDDAANTSTCSFEISVVSNFEIDPQVLNLSCANDNDGAIDLNIIGEGSDYVVDWSGPAGFSSEEESLTDLGAGTYSVAITSANGCSRSAEFTVSSPDELSIEGTSSPNTTGNNGSITVNVEGGTEPYTFSWVGPNNFQATSQNLENLSDPGFYILTIIDSNGCTVSFEIELDSTVGVNDIQSSLAVYPNPLTSNLHLELPSEFIGKPLIIYDVAGKTLDQFLIDDVLFTINMENYPGGLYFLEVESIGRTFKIVKQ